MSESDGDRSVSRSRSGSSPKHRSFLCPHCGAEHAAFVVRCPEKQLAIDWSHKMSGRMLESKYLVGERIAVGGMGVVYEGKHVKIGRKVAVKFLSVAFKFDGFPGYCDLTIPFDPVFFGVWQYFKNGLSHYGFTV